MAPADPKDWLFAAVALTTAATAAPAMAEGQTAGVVTGAVASTRVLGGGPTDVAAVVLGDAVQAGEELRTGPNGIIHVLFLDQSSVTLGPDSRLTVDLFSHDAATRSGKIGMTLHGGSVRVVGGMNSKVNETEVRTAGGTVGILGGISIVESQGPGTVATFLFGQQMRLTDQNGQTETLLRPGFSLTSTQNGVQAPQVMPPQQLSSLTRSFESGRGDSASGPQSTPAPTPSAPLIATSDRPPGEASPAQDRLGNPGSALVGAAMGSSRPGVAAGSDGAPPVNAVRTTPPVATS
ncbi:FecR family protein [Magnetospirillum molischianum]|uniref:FecR protein domain-containing protein n=1 Tax=Magnetospirillum molischianum DSM 120 TaxID=1150626 RepID=H8FS24_MAGML|nr:FecR family protein [Magnetospirillum molischianum]CCG41162.1 conserved exported hypothetical protein [Magnetospirillum molischianum DSM 120]